MVQGDYAAASTDCAQTARTAGLSYGAACNANLFSYTGRARESVALLTALSAGSPGSERAILAWIEGLLAEANERLGNWPSAETHYRKALSYTPDDNFLLVAYADFLLDRGRSAEVLTLLGAFAQSDTVYLRLALAHAALGTPEAPRYAWIMGARFDALAQRGSDFYGREKCASRFTSGTILGRRSPLRSATGRHSARRGMHACCSKRPSLPEIRRPRLRFSRSSAKRGSKTR